MQTIRKATGLHASTRQTASQPGSSGTHAPFDTESEVGDTIPVLSSRSQPISETIYVESEVEGSVTTSKSGRGMNLRYIFAHC
jgi:hypothetical protein